MTEQKVPKISIGIPLYNEEKYIAQTLDNILSQEGIADCEIIIADNASEDDSGNIIRSYIEKYPFIRYVRHDFNRGAASNWNYIVKESRGAYLVFAGAHDLWSDHYLEKLSEALDRNPKAVLASGLVQWIDEDGREIESNSEYPTGFVDTSGRPLVARIHQCLYMNPAAIYGMFRLDSLKKTRLCLNTLNCDVILLTELSLLGEFVVQPDVTWFWRQVRSKETLDERLARYRSSLGVKKHWSHWRMVLYFITILFRTRAKLTRKERLILTLGYVPNVFARFLMHLVYDIKKYLSFGQRRI
ncbi:MAG: glycosyltransferase family 2 protein [Candidatus Electrothrix sp. AW2]|nr:glycosyltransferase family 2 protein [Candidatus Electrothrix gigas]